MGRVIGKQEISAKVAQEARFDEYLKLFELKPHNGNYELLETAFAVQCDAMIKLANQLYPEKRFTEEDAVDCVLIALNNRNNNGQITFLPKLFIDLYNEIESSQGISSSVLEIIKDSWGINIYDEKDDFDNIDLLVGVTSDI